MGVRSEQCSWSQDTCRLIQLNMNAYKLLLVVAVGAASGARQLRGMKDRDQRSLSTPSPSTPTLRVMVMLMVIMGIIMETTTETTPPGLLPRIWEPEPSVREPLMPPPASLMSPEPPLDPMARDVLTRSR